MAVVCATIHWWCSERFGDTTAQRSDDGAHVEPMPIRRGGGLTGVVESFEGVIGLLEHGHSGIDRIKDPLVLLQIVQVRRICCFVDVGVFPAGEDGKEGGVGDDRANK